MPTEISCLPEVQAQVPLTVKVKDAHIKDKGAQEGKNRFLWQNMKTVFFPDSEIKLEKLNP